MLRKISVSGFKSLDQFRLDFRQGLNVIVGPNGSGKTNIINFIEFLSYISTSSLLEAVGRSGGAGRIFRRKDTGSLTKSISFEIGGSGIYQRYSRDKPDQVSYEYAAEIQLSENNSAIYFQRQRLRVATRDQPIDGKTWPVDIEVITTSAEKSRTIFHNIDKRLVEDKYMPRMKRNEAQSLARVTG